MTEFDKAVKHVETCLFWDFVDGQWLDKLYTPLDRDFFNRLMQGVVEAHEAENAKLQELIANVHEALCADKAGMFHRLTLASMEDDMRELGLVVE